MEIGKIPIPCEPEEKSSNNNCMIQIKRSDKTPVKIPEIPFNERL